MRNNENNKNTIEYEKDDIFQTDCAKVFNKLPNSIHSLESFAQFKDKTFRFFLDKTIARTISFE